MGLMNTAAILSLETEKSLVLPPSTSQEKKNMKARLYDKAILYSAGQNGPRVTKAHYSIRAMRSGSHGPRDRPDRGPLIHLGYVTEVN